MVLFAVDFRFGRITMSDNVLKIKNKYVKGQTSPEYTHRPSYTHSIEEPSTHIALVRARDRQRKSGKQYNNVLMCIHITHTRRYYYYNVGE